VVTRFELLLRRNLATGLRRFLRLGRHLLVQGETSPPLPPHLVRDWPRLGLALRSGAGLAQCSCIAEVGTYKGDFARHILAHARLANCT
jgi:hypothetical protein